MPPIPVAFFGGAQGEWRVVRARTIRGPSLASVERLAMRDADAPPPAGPSAWVLRGVTSHQRYVHRAEADQLVARQASLGRPEATCAAMIPIRKSERWWSLAQDERRAIFETKSAHVSSTLRFLPEIARRLHHGRDLGEPFDFVTWFEYAPEHETAFDELVASLRATEEWTYVEREIDLRLVRER